MNKFIVLIPKVETEEEVEGVHSIPSHPEARDL